MFKFLPNSLYLFFLLYSSLAFASDANFNNTTQLPLAPNPAGNVGIGSANPGQTLDVQGSVRALNFFGNGSGLTNLTGANFWLNDTTGNVGISTAYAVGIGTSFVGGTGEAALSVMNGNVGIGTWVPNATLAVVAPASAGDETAAVFSANVAAGSSVHLYLNNTAGASNFSGEFNFSSNGVVKWGIGNDWWGVGSQNFYIHDFVTDITRLFIDPLGNVGIGTFTPLGGLVVTNGNVGIGSAVPGQLLDVQGTVRMLGFNIANNAGAGKVLTSDVNGNGTWGAAGAGSNYWLLNGGTNVGINTTQAVGIGTSFVGGAGEAKLSVMNGNVGIGTWIPGAALDLPYYPSGTGIHGGIGFGVGAGSQMSLYQNSSNTMQFNVQAGINFDNDFGFGVSFNPGHLFEIQHYGDDASTADVFFQFGTDASITGLDIANGELIQTASVFHPNSGTYNYSALMINDTINQTGTSAGITRGLFVNPVLTSTRDFRAIETAIGNVGIGTISGNLGIGSQWPGQRLDINGTARMTGFTLTGNGAANGNVLVGNSVGVGTWMPASTLGVSGGAGTNYWLNDTGNVGINTAYAVGIGTISQVNKLNILGNIGIGTFSYDPYMKTLAPSGGMIISGNVGIGSWAPTMEFDIEALQGPAGDIMTIGDSAGTYFIVSGEANKGGIETSTISPINPTLNIWSGSGSGSAGTQFNHIGINDSYTSGTGQLVQLWADSGDGQFNPSSGNGVYDMLEVDPNINQTGTSAGITRGLFVNPVLTSTRDFRAIETAIGNVGIGTISGNLGIGSQWPGQRLDINGTARMTGFTLTGNGAANGDILVGNSVGIGTWMATSTLTPGLLNSGTINQAAYYTGATALSSNSHMVFNGANIGIGTVNPTTPLQVIGNVGIGTNAVASTPSYTLNVNNTVVFNSEYDNGNGGGSATINWNNGNKQKLTLSNGASCTLTFTAPSGSAMLLLKLVQGTANSTVTWPASPTVKWTSGTQPTLSTAANSIDLVSCYYDGSTYFCIPSLNFQ